MRKKIAILICSIIVSLFLAEMIVRWLKLAPVMLDFNIIYNYQFVENPRICYMTKPRSDEEINSQGFRDKEFSLKKGSGLVRIIMLGDSITYGAFVKRNECFSDRLEKMLKAKTRQLSSPMRYEVMNFGVGGYNIVSEIEVLKVYGLKYKPDLVILNYFWNDDELYSHDYWNFLKRDDIAPTEKNWARHYYLDPTRFRWNRLFFRSHLFVYIWTIVNQFRESRLELQGREYTTYKKGIVLEKLKDLKKLSARHNFKILICMHPVLDYDKNKPNPNYLKTKKIAKSLGIPCVNLLKHYKKQSNDPGIFLTNEKDPYHPNAKGHNLIARSLMLELIKAGYIKE